MRFKIYYLDDEPDLLQIFEETFQEEKTEITTFSEPRALIEAAGQHPPHLLFLDFRLPNITGVQIARQLDPLIPKILVTGDMSLPKDETFLIQFEKPIDAEIVGAFIEKHRQAFLGKTS